MLLLLPLILNSVGVLAVEPVSRIVGGHRTSITTRPFQIVICYVTPNGPAPGCGGAIIHNRWIVTAAHCVYRKQPDSIVIEAGTDRLTDENKAVWFEVESVIAHELFDMNSDLTSHDIGLIRTKTEIAFTQNIQLIGVRTEPPQPGSEIVISGFGVTEPGLLTMSDVLEEVSVTVLDRDYCLELISGITTQLQVSDTHFCAAELKGGKDACQGDSGGPATIDGSLAGVVSWGIGCAGEMIPAFYTDVSQFVSWIETNLKTNHLTTV